MKLNLGLLLLSCSALLPHIPSAQADDGPLTCRYLSFKRQINCEVAADQADVTKIVLNRGNCYMPPALPADLRTKYLQQIPNGELINIDADLWKYAIANVRQNPDEQKRRNDEILNSPNDGALYFYFTLNPTRQYKFGDSFKIDATACSVLEYTISVNGQDWTWKTQ